MDLLFEISEPGQSPKPHEQRPALERRVVGIDLGTTYSLAAAITPDGKPLCLADDQGRFTLPSVVHYQADGAILVGFEAREQAVSHPSTTILSVKRFMGRGLAELEPANSPYQMSQGEGGMVRFIVADNRQVSPVEISAEILRTLKTRAEQTLGGPLFGAVVTVPAYFDDAQRQATKDACRLAGLEVLRLVNEPTAAALAYGLEQAQEGLFAIYDLGGGTFDISILKLTKGVFQVLSTGGNSALGGDDFDHALANHLLEAMGIATPSPTLMQHARQNARLAKEQLSEAESTVIQLPQEDGSSFTYELTSATFESLIDRLVRQTGTPCRRALKDAGIQAGELNGVVLVGGSTRVPLVRRYVAELFDREPLCELDPDQVVALGAAHQAELLAGRGRSDLLLLDVTPLSLGVETMGDLVERIIPRNSPIPTARGQEFTTFKDGQTAMAIHVVQGERDLVSQCRSLARFELRGIPPMTAGAARIQVTFRVDADGLLTVTAQEKSTGIAQEVAVKPTYGLTDGEIEQMLLDALEHSADDVQARQLAEARVEAERVVAALGAALKQDGDLLNETELRQLKKVMLHLWEVARGTDPDRINATMTEVDQASQYFAQRRMDRSVQQAMAGHHIEEFDSPE